MSARRSSGWRTHAATSLLVVASSMVGGGLLFGDGAPRDDARGANAAPLGEDAQRGRSLYHEGIADPPVELVLSSSDLALPATAFPCGNCHGRSGEGTEEGGVAPPPIRWRELHAPATSPLTGLVRPAHTRATLIAAITEGKAPDGSDLHPGMPRYRLSESQADDLLAYLEVLGTAGDLDPGVTAERVRVGCFLPLTGARAPGGESVRRALDAFFGFLNERGGVYGRQVEMVYADLGDDAVTAEEAARRLISEEQVFAIIASFVPVGASAVYSVVEEAGVPFIGPLTIPPRPDVPPERTVFHLLSSHYDQARVLVEFAATAPDLPKTGYALVFIDDGAHRDARDGVVDQIAVFGGALAGEVTYVGGAFDAEAVVETLREGGTEAVLMFGAQRDIVSFAEAMQDAGLRWPLLTTGSTLGRAAFDLPPVIADRTFLTYPSAQPTRKQLEWVLTLAADRELVIDHPAQQGPALAAAKIFVEGMKRVGRRLGREAWIEAAEELAFFETGVVPPVSYTLNQRTGALGASMMRIEIESQRFIPASGWFTTRSPNREASDALAAPETSEEPRR